LEKSGSTDGLLTPESDVSRRMKEGGSNRVFYRRIYNDRQEVVQKKRRRKRSVGRDCHPWDFQVKPLRISVDPDASGRGLDASEKTHIREESFF
jgi:hypothetical protein